MKLTTFENLHIVYENCDMSIIPYDKIRFFSFDNIYTCASLLNWNMDGEEQPQFDLVDETKYFKEGAIVLKPSAGEILTEFSKSTGINRVVTTAERIFGNDITQLHFYDSKDVCTYSIYVDYQEEDESLGSPNRNQHCHKDEDGDFWIDFKTPIADKDIIVKYHSDASKPITQAHEGEWCDLRSGYDVEISKGERGLIDLGVSIKVPEGHEAIMAPRSSTFKNYGLLQTNGIGVFDERYCGNNDKWYFPCYATRDTKVCAGDRIAQFRVQPIQGKLNITEVDDMEAEDRGGLGSTGI